MNRTDSPFTLLVSLPQLRSPVRDVDRDLLCPLPVTRRTLEAATWSRAREADPAGDRVVLLSG